MTRLLGQRRSDRVRSAQKNVCVCVRVCVYVSVSVSVCVFVCVRACVWRP